MNKFRNPIKMILIALLVLTINGPLVAFARAGGGGGGGSSGGGGGGGSTGSTHSRSSRKSSPIENIISFGLFAVAASAGTIVLKVKLGKKKAKTISAIKDLSKSDNNWNYKNIKQDIEGAFYKVQTAWMERNQDLAKEYMSDELYTKHRTQTEWMKVRKQKNILEDMELLRATPVGIEDHEGIDRDSIWVHIKASSQDYMIDEETDEVVEGEAYKFVQFEEYWKFIRKEYRWVLDEIRQINEINNLDFFVIDVEKND